MTSCTSSARWIRSRPRPSSRSHFPAEIRPTTTKFPGVTVASGYGFLTVDPSGVVTADTSTTGATLSFVGIEDVEFQAGAGGSQKAAVAGAGAGPG